MKTQKINYVIASYGKNLRKSKLPKYPPPELTLIEHLNSLLEFQHNLNKITIVKPYIKKKNNEEELFYNSYYNIENLIKKFKIKVEIYETKNECFSFGQFIEAFKFDKGESDFFICTEDDFVINRDNFDIFLTEYYFSLFKNHLGILTNHVTKSKLNFKNIIFYIYNFLFKYIKIYPLNFFDIIEGIIVINKKTVTHFFDQYKNPKLEMKRLNIKNNSIFGLYKNKKNQFIGYEGGFYQTGISYLYNKINIPIKALDKNKNVIFWWNEKNDSLEIVNKKDSNPLNYLKHIPNTLFIPIQLKQNFIKNNINKHKYVHRYSSKKNNNNFNR